LRQVQSDRSNLAHGWLPFAADSITAVWHSDAARGPSTPSFDHLVGDRAASAVQPSGRPAAERDQQFPPSDGDCHTRPFSLLAPADSPSVRAPHSRRGRLRYADAGHAGATANLKLTFHLDHSAGADQNALALGHGAG